MNDLRNSCYFKLGYKTYRPITETPKAFDPAPFFANLIDDNDDKDKQFQAVGCRFF